MAHVALGEAGSQWWVCLVARLQKLTNNKTTKIGANCCFTGHWPRCQITETRNTLAMWSTSKSERNDGPDTRRAYARCPLDSYVEFNSGQWLVVPFEPVMQPPFFTCLPSTG